MTKLVIDIPRKTYEHIRSWGGHGIFNIQGDDNLIVTKAIFNGTPLPKDHGKLIILDEAKAKVYFTKFSFSVQDWISAVDMYKAALKLIEADKETENDE